MAEINWGLAQGGGAQNALATGFQIGQALGRRHQEQRFDNAYGALVANPQADDAQFNEIIRGLPARDAAQLANQRAQMMQSRQAQERDALPVTLNMLRAATPENWSGLRQRAIQLGIPGAQNAPEQFDPAWRDAQVQQLQAFSSPQAQEALSTAGKQAVDEGLRPGTPEFSQRVTQIWQANNAKPYIDSTGATRLYVPGGSQQPSAIPQDAINALRSGQGTPEQFDEIFGAGAAQRIMGGGVSNGVGGF